MTLALVPAARAQPNDPALVVVSDAAGRMRVRVEWVRCDSRRAVAVEEAVAKQNGVRAVHAYPRTGSVVVWYSPRRCDRSVGTGGDQRRRARRRRTDSGTRAAFVGDPQHRRAAHGDRRRGAGPARRAPLRVRPTAAARPERPAGRHRRHHLHRLPVPARRAALAALRQGRHRCAGLGRDRGEPGAARERGRAHRAVAAQYR